MRKLIVGLTSLALALAFAGTGFAAAPPVGVEAADPPDAAVTDELPNPLEEKRRALREEALNLVLSGEAQPEQRGASTVVNVGETVADDGARRAGADGVRTDDQYVELARETTDRVFVIVAEFGDLRDPRFPDQDTDPLTEGPVLFDGPLHNQIPEPDRSVDNSTIWQADYSSEHYNELYFSDEPGRESLKQYWERQSSGRYSIDGIATEWVKVRYNEARYGRSGDPDDTGGGDTDGDGVCGDIVCNNTWNLVDDAMDQWVADQEAAGRSDAEIAEELASFDVYDRYDYDSDGDFNEPDGYIDHLQVIHAGGSEANGDPQYGEDAIWAHRWYAFGTDFGETGPEDNLAGGAEIGDTGIWAGDYTIQPENSGSVINHEYGHDLGLPDHYDTAGGGDNAVNWWTLMAQNRVSAEGDEGIGTRAADLSAWDKLQLGWLDYEVALAGQDRRYVLGPHEYNTANPQALVVVLPDKEVVTDLGAPYVGDAQFWSGTGDDLANTMTTTLDFESVTTTAEMTLQARYDIEAGYDYLYAQVSLDEGATWTALDGTVDGEPFSRDASGTPAIEGTSDGWVPVVIPMDDAIGQVVQFRFLYRTDGGVAPIGFFADEILVTADGETVLADGAEEGGPAWTFDGFSVVGATETNLFEHYYIASNRQYVSYDQYLRTGPYNFGFTPELPDLVEHFPYQNGLLISYWDTSFGDNNESQHPGRGLVLPIDSHPQPIYRLDGTPWRGRIQTYDAPFTRERADSFTLHYNGQPSYIRGQRGNPTFDDTQSYWSPELPNVGVITPGVGVGISVLRERGTTMTVRLFPTGE